jgi:hypothetical protein
MAKAVPLFFCKPALAWIEQRPRNVLARPHIPAISIVDRD